MRSSPASTAAVPIDLKTVATLKARAAMVGVILNVTTDDLGAPLFVVSRWSLTRQLHSIHEVETFLRRAGGPNA